MSPDPVPLPHEAREWQRIVVTGVARDDLELALNGSYAIGPRYLDAVQRRSVSHRGLLTDGAGWELPLALQVEAESAVVVGETAVLTDTEGVPLALLTVEEVATTDSGHPLAAGPLTTLRSSRAAPAARAASAPVLAVVTDRPLHTHDVEQTRRLADGAGARVLLLALTGGGRPHGRTALLRSLDLVRRGLDADLEEVPLPLHEGLEPVARSRLAARVAAAHGATCVLLPSGSGPSNGEDLGFGLPVPVHLGRAGTITDAELASRLETGRPLPPGFTLPAVEDEMRRAYPPLVDRGLVVFFTGLSGSGKSTLASAVAAALQDRGRRTVSLLDGDVVRSMLSSELSFTREHRELNVRRIGFVAAEVARHGGTAVCAPIAPYSASRALVRRMAEAVGCFVLVHVSTPLDVCESRDSKGLYARARAGLVPAFTGVTDPYEAPVDAELTIDTSTSSVEVCTTRVMTHLEARGLIAPPADPPTGAE